VKLPAECINAVVAWWAERWIPNETREAFRAALRLRLEAFETDVPPGSVGWLVQLDCDYDPKGMLLDAVHDAGVECVTIHVDNAEAKAGYGVSWVEIWKAAS
jgi:hypothetical protein